ETYTYSTDGKLRKAIYDNFDYWLNGIILYEYDDKNNISRGSFKGKDGYNADISFTCDDDGNITKIHWEFSFGKTQTYTFEYERIE
ncbi:MAG: hypothetical protein GY863_06980, partial [bacterium]|nr:hypothetical protein [bacterium]